MVPITTLRVVPIQRYRHLTLPSSFVGELDIFFTDGNQTFYGIIDAE